MNNYSQLRIITFNAIGGVIISKPIFQNNENIYMDDTISFIKSPMEIRNCEIYLTSKRIAAFERPSSFAKAVSNFFSDSKSAVFEIPLNEIRSIRNGKMGIRDIVILRVNSGKEYQLQFPLPQEKWKQGIIDAVMKNESNIKVKVVGDFIKFAKNQPV